MMENNKTIKKLYIEYKSSKDLKTTIDKMKKKNNKNIKKLYIEYELSKKLESDNRILLPKEMCEEDKRFFAKPLALISSESISKGLQNYKFTL